MTGKIAFDPEMVGSAVRVAADEAPFGAAATDSVNPGFFELWALRFNAFGVEDGQREFGKLLIQTFLRQLRL